MRARDDGFLIANVAGFPLHIAPSFPIAVLCGLVWCFNARSSTELLDHLIFLPLGLASIIAHELGHAGVARALGMPVRHIALTGYGGYASFWLEPNSRSRESAIAFAGPAANLAIAAITFVLLPEMEATAPWRDPVWARVLQTVFWFNLGLGLFNLLPGLPLDGGHIVRAALSAWMSRGRASWIAAWLGVAAGVAVIGVAANANQIGGIVIGTLLTAVAWREKRLLRYN